MNIIFSKALGEYYSHRETCGMKDSPKECIDKFYSRSKKEFPGEKCLTQEMIDAWWTKRPTESSNTHAVRVCQVLPFLRFVAERYPESHYIIRKTPKWKHTTYLPHIYTKEELKKFFTACDTMGRPYNNLECKLNEIELPILFRLLYSTGMRTTEVRLLRTENVDLSKGVIYISKDATKRYRERKVLVHDCMLEILRIYDKAVSALVPDRKVFFPNDHDGTHSDGWLSSHFSRIWKSAGNPAGVVAYDLRHNFIIERINSWTDDGYEIHSDLVTLSLYVGHSKL